MTAVPFGPSTRVTPGAEIVMRWSPWVMDRCGRAHLLLLKREDCATATNYVARLVSSYMVKLLVIINPLGLVKAYILLIIQAIIEVLVS